MGRIELRICVRCDGGEDLYREVKSIRRDSNLKAIFKVEDVRCLGLCDGPAAVEFHGKKRSTYSRCQLGAGAAAEVVRAACAYAGLSPGQELSELVLPGEAAD